jgi:hypothetical protein
MHLRNNTLPIDTLDIEWQDDSSSYLPKKWTNAVSLDGQRLWRSVTLNVTAVESEPAMKDAEFTLVPRPGMLVKVAEFPAPGSGLDPVRAARTEYRVTDSGAWKETSAKGFTTLGGEELPPARRWPLWLAWVGGVVAVIAVVGIWRRWRVRSME